MAGEASLVRQMHSGRVGCATAVGPAGARDRVKQPPGRWILPQPATWAGTTCQAPCGQSAAARPGGRPTPDPVGANREQPRGARFVAGQHRDDAGILAPAVRRRQRSERRRLGARPRCRRTNRSPAARRVRCPWRRRILRTDLAEASCWTRCGALANLGRRRPLRLRAGRCPTVAVRRGTTLTPRRHRHGRRSG